MDESSDDDEEEIPLQRYATPHDSPAPSTARTSNLVPDLRYDGYNYWPEAIENKFVIANARDTPLANA
uniref:Uncharacterized protein n=1 Tax=Acrobeloides nanus TaxID=290746 RepID=A0A914CV53_9BILA